jgi:hypothetical protein
VANTFGDAYYSFFNPADSTATEQTLTLPLTTAQFPFSNIGPPTVTDVTLIVVLAEPLTSALATALGDGLALDGTFGPAGGTPQAVTLVAAPGTTASGAPVAGLTSGQVTLTPAAPEPLTLTVPQASLPAQETGTATASARDALAACVSRVRGLTRTHGSEGGISVPATRLVRPARSWAGSPCAPS